jgi:hypothetical protein
LAKPTVHYPVTLYALSFAQYRDDARGLTDMAICGLPLASKPRMNRELSEWVGDNPAYRRIVVEALGVVHVLITARNNRRWSHAL